MQSYLADFAPSAANCRIRQNNVIWCRHLVNCMKHSGPFTSCENNDITHKTRSAQRIAVLSDQATGNVQKTGNLDG